MNKKQREELTELAKQFSKQIPNEREEYDCDRYFWDKFGDAFYDWLCTQKHSLDMEKMFDLMMEFREKLPSGENMDDWDETWANMRNVWKEAYTKFVTFCIGK